MQQQLPPISVDITEVGELTSFLQRADAVYTIIKTKYRGLVNKLQQFLDDDGCDEETFQAGISHLTSAVGVMNSMNVQQLIPAKELHQIQTVHVNPGSILQRGNAYQTTSKPTAIKMDECKSHNYQ